MDKYNVGYDQQNGQGDQSNRGFGPDQVVVHNPGGFTVVTQGPEWSWCTLVTSVISLFCCQCFGLPAMILSILAYADHKVKHFDASRSKLNVALGLAITAIVLGGIGYLIVIIAVSVALPAAVNASPEDNWST